MNRSALLTLAFVVLILTGGALLTYYLYITPNDASNSDASKTLALGDAAFTDIDGNTISFESYEGKVRVVNSWASWSPYSVQELQDLDALAEAYAHSGVAVFGINRKEPKEAAERFLRTLPALEHMHIVLDPGDAFFEALEGYAMPETVIYDTNGNIYFHKRGPMTRQEMEQKTQEALQQGT